MKTSMRMCSAIIIASIILFMSPASNPDSLYALDIYGIAAAAASTETASPLYVDFVAGLEHKASDFTMTWELGFDSAGKYKAPYFGDYFGDVSVDIEKAGFAYKNNGFSVDLGKKPLSDAVKSPYSLFQNASGLSALGAEIGYEDDGFFYRDRWILLNRSLRTTLYTDDSRDLPGIVEDPAIYDDRGAVLKTYGIKMGNFRFGYQDAVIFTGSFFDIDYFANPAPTIFIQYIAKSPGRPWSRSEGDHNAIMGLFADYEDGSRYAYAQILVDDINMNRFINPSGKQNPDKIAWSIGGQMENRMGRFGLYHAGATKYTFESALGKYYSYTLYPGSAVLWKDSASPLAIEDTMLGYMKGENNIALLGTWMNNFREFDLAANLELSLSGSKSPANPWHAYGSLAEAGEGTKLLDDAALEKKIVLGIEAGRPIGNFYLGVAGKIGYVGNRLQAEATPITEDGTSGTGNAQPVFAASGESGFIGEIAIFGRIAFR